MVVILIDLEKLLLSYSLSGRLKVLGSRDQIPRQRRISTIAKTPNIRCFVVKLHLSRFTRFLGMIFPSFDSNSNRFVNHQNIFAFNEKYFYRQNKLAIDRTGWLSIEPVGYRWLSLNPLAIDRTGWLSIELVGYRQNRLAIVGYR